MAAVPMRTCGTHMSCCPPSIYHPGNQRNEYDVVVDASCTSAQDTCGMLTKNTLCGNASLPFIPSTTAICSLCCNGPTHEVDAHQPCGQRARDLELKQLKAASH